MGTKELQALCERGLALAAKRNLAVHGLWAPQLPGGESRAMSWFKVPVGERLKMLPEREIGRLVWDVAKLASDLSGWLTPRGAFAPLQRKPRGA